MVLEFLFTLSTSNIKDHAEIKDEPNEQNPSQFTLMYDYVLIFMFMQTMVNIQILYDKY